MSEYMSPPETEQEKACAQSDELAAKWKYAIMTAWNKNPGYGKCKVVFDVEVNRALGRLNLG